jgi:hypothetical protein
MTTTTLPTDTSVLSPSPPRRRWLRVLIAIPIILIALVLLLAGSLFAVAATNLASAPYAPVMAQSTQFDGRTLLVASDADMVASAYADGRLMQIPGDVDTLSLIPLPVTDANASVIEIPASNSVTSWPQITAVSPDGNTVYVVETAGQVDDTVENLPESQLPEGRLLTVIDIGAGADAEAAVQTVDVGSAPVHIAISAEGAYLAVGLREEGRQLAILPTATLDDPSTFRYFPVERGDGAPAGEVSSVFWHPSGDFLAIGIDRQEIAFYRVTPDASGTPTIAPHGERITGGITLTYGQFTNDGRFYLTSEINWDRFPPPLRNLINPPSEMLSVRFDPSDAAEHGIVSRIPVGQSAESFAVSRDERLIVSVDMGRTYLPNGLTFWPGATTNTLTLLTFDLETGVITPTGERYGFEGVLPEAAMFDADGDALAVVIYNERENPMNPGYIEFWNVIRDDAGVRLERTSVRVPVVRGGHAMNFIP